MRYAEVSVNSPAAQRRTFSYAVPPGLSIDTGQAVWVPFGSKTLQGIVLELTDYPAVEETREIIGTIDPHPFLSPDQVALARWLSDHYLSPLFDAISPMLPPGFERRTITLISSTDQEYASASHTQPQRQVLRLARRGPVNLSALERALGKKKAQTTVTQLVRSGLVTRSYELEKVRVRPKIESYLSLNINTDEARQEAVKLRGQGTSRQAALLDFLAQQQEPVSISQARHNTGSSKAAADALEKKGLVKIQRVEVRKQPFTHQGITPTQPLHLTSAQESAFRSIWSSLTEKRSTSPQVFLLHGVTGSGKTEVYLQALAETVRLGKRGIVLVPEISLTPQTIERFAARFPNRVAVLHSQLSLREQFDEWQSISDGDFDVIIGPRSAVFAPQPDLGLIVMDEEHEWTYKQQEQSPRYHTRDVAIKLAEFTGAVVILGSATPDIETYYHAQQGNYHLLRLPERVVAGGGPSLPRTEVVDLREELKRGNRSIFSTDLSGAIETVLANGEQAILFLNRRGAANSVQCRDCGYVLACRRCEIPLSYHLAEDILLCHQCNQQSPTPQTCPRCESRRIRYLGIGTQKLEQETRQAFPGARLLRWDSDVTRGKNSHQVILDRFRKHEADILIGTQMVAKGLDLPRVTLVGVISADTSLNLPDFRAGERTFQLLSQVAGRAGRSALGGRVIIQTYTPKHYAIQAAADHDYDTLYREEIAYRQQLHNPPFTRLASLIYTHTNDAACQKAAERMQQRIIEERDRRGIADLSLIGPAPAFIHRRRGRYRWQLVLRSSDPSAILSQISIPQGWTMDIDPVGL
ncbi:MAG: primosomal protein N' [Dehalococcoidales bacterium]|nr:MAG: primosomal protein N' [Dehalococcoidales bacterium]